MITKKEYRKVIRKCVTRYEEDWTDCDVIRPLDHMACRAKDFLEWLREYSPRHYKEAMDMIPTLYIGVRANYPKSDDYNLFDVMTDINIGFDKGIKILCDYAEFNEAFKVGSYLMGKNWLDSEK